MNVCNYWDVADTIAVGKEPYRALADAVIMYAVSDYRDEMVKNYRSRKGTSKQITEIEKFFRSYWFTRLTDIDGEWLLRKTKGHVQQNDFPPIREAMEAQADTRKEKVMQFVCKWWADQLLQYDLTDEKYERVKEVFRETMYKHLSKEYASYGDMQSFFISAYADHEIIVPVLDELRIGCSCFSDYTRRQKMLIDSYTVRLYDMSNPKNRPRYLFNLDKYPEGVRTSTAK